MKLSKWAWFTFVAFFFACTPLNVIGFIDANISTTGDTSGSTSARAKVNFTEHTITQNAGQTVLTLSNPEGDTLSLTFFGSQLQTGTFTISSQNTLTGTLTITSNLTPVTHTISAASGQMVLTRVVATNGSTPTILGGQFDVNLTGGGAAVGQFNTEP